MKTQIQKPVAGKTSYSVEYKREELGSEGSGQVAHFLLRVHEKASLRPTSTDLRGKWAT